MNFGGISIATLLKEGMTPVLEKQMHSRLESLQLRLRLLIFTQLHSAFLASDSLSAKAFCPLQKHRSLTDHKESINGLHALA